MRQKSVVKQIKIIGDKLFLTFKKSESATSKWALENVARVFIFQSIIMSLVVLHSLGYFHPFFTISAHFIIFTSLILAVLILKARSYHLALFSLITFLGSAFFLVYEVEVWATRLAMYTSESFFVCLIVFALERYRLIPTNTKDTTVK